MKCNQTYLFVIYRNGKPFRHFAAQQTALNYLAACCDLYPGDNWDMQCPDYKR